MYLIRTWSYDSSIGGEVEHRWSTGGFTTRPDESDTGVNEIWDGRIKDPGNWESHLFTQNKTMGRSESSAGVITLLNLDGALDGLWKNGWGRPLEIYSGPDTAQYFSEFTLLATHTVVGVDRKGRTLLQLSFQDFQAILANKLVNPTEFLGTNVGATGLEGLATDLRGQKKPFLVGSAAAIPAPQVNGQSLMYQVSTTAAQTITVSVTTDRGATLGFGTTYSSLAALQDATTPATKYDVYLGTPNVDASYFKLGSLPSGMILVTAAEGTNDGQRTVAQTIKRVLKGPGGLTDSDLVLDSFTALDAADSSVVGFWAGTSEIKLGDVLDALCESIGAFWRITPEGKVAVGLFAVPVAEEAVIDIPGDFILESGFELTIPADFVQGIPPHKITVEYAKHYYVFDENDLAGSVSEAVKAEMSKEFRRTVSTEIAGVLTKHPGSEEYVRTTLLRDSTAAVNVQARMVSLYGVERELAILPLHVSVAGGVTLHDTILVTDSRFGWNEGAAFRVIGRIHEYAKSRVVLICWR